METTKSKNSKNIREERIRNKRSKFKSSLKTGFKSVKNKKFSTNVENKNVENMIKSKMPEKIWSKKPKKYDRGGPPDMKMIKVHYDQIRIAKREEKIRFGIKQSIRSELLLTEDSGYLVPDESEVTSQFTQANIKNSVDPLSASKRFDLDLRDFGPYRMNYTRNGRFLLLGGRKGHVAAFNWIEKKLLCEINVMESVYDVAWLHQETLYAVAQKKWVYIYDNQGVEIHCIKKLFNVCKMMFLPYHFLLVAVSTNRYISWLDVSVGQMVEQFHLRNNGTASTITQHPANAMICVGEPNGTISFWSPNNKKPSVTKLCHMAPISAVAFDPRGLKFTTAALDRTIKIWDARNLDGPLQYYTLRSAPQCISMSHRGTTALGLGNLVEVYNDNIINGIPEKKIYLRHTVSKTISNMEFCPFEDILGVAHSAGFTSMLVPGCGEPNFDALEINPFQTKSQRREAEVKSLLSKIPSDLITWDSTELRKVDIPSLEEIIEAKKKVAYIKPPEIHFVPKKKMGKQSGSAKAFSRKNIMKEEFRRTYVKEMKALKGEGKLENSNEPDKSAPYSVLDRFKVKPKS